MDNNLISVVMPVYNTEKYVSQAIQSILNQTYTNFEFIIIDDGSTDNSKSLIKEFNDPRILLVESSTNEGLVASLNKGLELAKGKYIARMDSDDISYANRFEHQLEFLETNPDITLCGSWFKRINSSNISKYPSLPEEIKLNLLTHCPIGHPTVMMRSDFLKVNHLSYNKDFEPAEDYALWSQICINGKLANIPEVLLEYRVHHEQTSVTGNKIQEENSNRIRVALLQKMMPGLPINYNLILPEKDCNSENTLFSETLKRIASLDILAKENEKLGLFEQKMFSDFLVRILNHLVTHFFHNPLAYNVNNLRQLMLRGKFFFKHTTYQIIFKYMIKSIISYKREVQVTENNVF